MKGFVDNVESLGIDSGGLDIKNSINKVIIYCDKHEDLRFFEDQKNTNDSVYPSYSVEGQCIIHIDGFHFDVISNELASSIRNQVGCLVKGIYLPELGEFIEMFDKDKVSFQWHIDPDLFGDDEESIGEYFVDKSLLYEDRDRYSIERLEVLPVFKNLNAKLGAIFEWYVTSYIEGSLVDKDKSRQARGNKINNAIWKIIDETIISLNTLIVPFAVEEFIVVPEKYGNINIISFDSSKFEDDLYDRDGSKIDLESIMGKGYTFAVGDSHANAIPFIDKKMDHESILIEENLELLDKLLW